MTGQEGEEREGVRDGTGFRGTGWVETDGRHGETERCGEGRDRTERDWTGLRGMERGREGRDGGRGTGRRGEGRDRTERDWTGGRGTERHGGGRDRTERKLEVGTERDQMEREGPAGTEMLE